jgi:protein-S-isoprenylcysteine O-methyltransferase Ste14
MLQRFLWVSAYLADALVLAMAASVLFSAARAGRRRAVTSRRHSPVNTLSMALCALVASFVVRFRVGQVVILDLGVAAAVAGAGLLLMVAAVVVNILARVALGRSWSDQPVVYREHALVTSGPYAVVRHPLYSSYLAMFYGAGLVFANLAVVVLASALVVPLMIARARLEERMLTVEFPDYLPYKERTGMMLPRLRRRVPPKSTATT